MHIAIIGAGISGLTCAGQLQAQGHSVTVYEKGSELGGRCATRDTELGGFDHGAQYFTAASEWFKNQVDSWRKAGLVATWDGKLVKLDQGVAKAGGRSAPRYVAMPGMNALGRHLAQGLDVRTEQAVAQIEPFGRQWRLALQSVGLPVEASAGPFDAVIIATPVNQAKVLLEPAAALAKQAAKINTVPCWTVMLGFQDSLQLGYDGAWVSNSRLGWIARDGAKPGRRPGEHWVGQATAEWSTEHLEDDPERVREKLLKAFHEATDSHVQPVYAVAQRWLVAQVPKPLGKDCLWDPKLRIGACGDWFAAGLEGGGRLENAYLSGLMLAELIA
jgi:renalase